MVKERTKTPFATALNLDRKRFLPTREIAHARTRYTLRLMKTEIKRSKPTA